MSIDLRVANAYALLTLHADWLPAEQLLAGSNINEHTLAQTEFIPWQTLLKIYANLDESGVEPAWTVKLGERLNIATHGPLGFAALSAPTLGAAVEVMAEYSAVRISAITAAISHRNGRFALTLDDATGDSNFNRWVNEIIMKVIESLIATILGHPVSDNVWISFRHPEPDCGELLRRHYDSMLIFGAEQTGISIPESWQNLPSPLSNPDTYRSNILQCKEIIAAQLRPDDTLNQVVHILDVFFDKLEMGEAEYGPPPTLEQIAEELYVTPRTLIRRLERVNSSYRELLEEARKQRSQRMLRQVQHSVAEVASLLGYQEPSNFGRAFRRWHGTSPAAWRKASG